jgi:hypothetical protein
MPRLSLFLTVLLLVLLGAPPTFAADDRYLAGYAAAVFERQFNLKSQSLAVDNGVVTVSAAELGASRRQEVVSALRSIPGVAKVEVVQAPGAAPPGSGEAPATTGITRPPQTDWLPGGQLFNPLIADPRWPHFSAAYQYYINDRQLGNVSSVSFGETFAFYRDRIGDGFWELGIQGGVFALFSLDRHSKDLINADYLIAALAAYRIDRFSAMARFFHQSSHLGDEFLLANRIERINLSYESVDLKLSYDMGKWLGTAYESGAPFRVYMGGGYLFDQDPSHIKPWSVQGGVEFRSPWPGPHARFRPVAAVDVQSREENNWDADISARAGVQFDGVLLSRNMQILLEYFHGHSPNGQFYKQKIDYIGLGVHFHF